MCYRKIAYRNITAYSRIGAMSLDLDIEPDLEELMRVRNALNHGLN